MYNPITYNTGNGKLTISGNLFVDEKVHITFDKNQHLSLKLRSPEWTTPLIKLNGNVINTKADKNGYITIERDFTTSDNLVVELPMKARLEAQKGVNDSYALFYGPLMFVANLGIQKGDVYISTSQSSTYRGGGWISFDGDYTGSLTQYLYINNFNKDKINDYIYKSVIGGKVVLTIYATNQTMHFIPWMDCIYERYSMYMYYKNK